MDRRLADDRVQGVAHLMRDSRINQGRESFLGFDVVIEDVGGDIDKLQSDHLSVLS